MSRMDRLDRLRVSVTALGFSLARLRDASSVARLEFQELAMVMDDDMRESLDDAARSAIQRVRGSGRPEAGQF